MTTTHSTKDLSYILESDKLLDSIFQDKANNGTSVGIEIDEIFKESPVVNFIVNFPAKGYNFVSENVLTVFGVSGEELIAEGLSRSLLLFEKEHREIFSNKILGLMLEWLTNFSLSGKDVCKTKMTYHIYMLDRNGKKFSTMHILKPIVKNENGLPILAIKSIIDISLHKPIIQPNIRFEYLNSKDEYEMINNQVFHTGSSEEQSLSTREQEILTLVKNGYHSKEIASKLSLSLHTINNHRKNIAQKCKVKSLHQL